MMTYVYSDCIMLDRLGSHTHTHTYTHTHTPILYRHPSKSTAKYGTCLAHAWRKQVAATVPWCRCVCSTCLLFSIQWQSAVGLFVDRFFFPTCQVRVVRFYVSCPAPSSPFPSPPPSPSPRWTSFASSWSQWSSPDLICQFCLAVVVAGPHLRALDRSDRRRTSSASSWSQWVSPDFNRRESARCGPRRTSTGEGRSAVGLAGLQPARFGALWALPGFNRRDSARCGPRRTLAGPQRPETKPYRMPKRMSEDMPDRMSEDMLDRMSEDMPDRMPDRYAR